MEQNFSIEEDQFFPQEKTSKYLQEASEDEFKEDVYQENEEEKEDRESPAKEDIFDIAKELEKIQDAQKNQMDAVQISQQLKELEQAATFYERNQVNQILKYYSELEN